MTTNNEQYEDEDKAAQAEFEFVPPFLLDEANEAVATQTKAKGVVEKVNSRVVGYHFSGLHFYPGKDGVRDILVGDPGIPGVMSFKVIWKGTGKRNSIFTVPSNLVVVEEEELPIAIVGK